LLGMENVWKKSWVLKMSKGINLSARIWNAIRKELEENGYKIIKEGVEK